MLVENFRSVKNSGEIDLDPYITVIIGKNDSGKTNLLKAIESFKPEYRYVPDDLSYDIMMKYEKKEMKAENIPIVKLWFPIEDEDRKKLMEIHPKMGELSELQIQKDFGDTYLIWSLSLGVEEIVESINSEIEKVKTLLLGHTKGTAWYSSVWGIKYYGDNDWLKDNIDRILDSIYEKVEFSLYGIKDAAVKNEIEQTIERIKALRKRLYRTVFPELWFKKLMEIVPEFTYISDIQILTDSLPSDKFLDARSNYSTLDKLIRIADFDFIAYAKVPEPVRKRYRETAREKLKDVLGELGKLTIDVQDGSIKVFIEDKDGNLEPPGRKSQGFQWLCSFRINMCFELMRRLTNRVFLFDDIGVHLHASWQRKLMEYLEKVCANAQVIISTHSPFMIERGKLERLKILERDEVKGSIVESKFYVSSFDTLEPVRAAIGAKIGDTLFAGEWTLIVEGNSDRLILEAMSRLCKQRGLCSLETLDLVVLGAGGAQRVPYFAAFLGVEKMKLIVLVDDDGDGRNARDRMIEKGLAEECIVKVSDVGLESTREWEIEDLFSEDSYLQAVNRAYAKIFGIEWYDIKPIVLEKDKRRTWALKKFFEQKRMGDFDKNLVAREILDGVVNGSLEVDKATADRFRKLIELLVERMK